MHEAFHFLSVHPKFEVEIPINRSKLPSKNPHSLIASCNEVLVSDDVVTTEEPAQNYLFVICPSKKTRSTEREAVKQSDSVICH